MKRSKSEAEETRRRLLQAGLEVFMQRGFDKASLEEIAQRVNMTRGAVYWHFKDKQALLQELAERLLKAAVEELYELLNDDEIPPLQKITSFIKSLLHLMAESDDFRNGQQLLRRCGPSLPRHAVEYSLWQEPYLLALEKLFWQAQTDRAVLAHVSPRNLATYTLSLINGYSQHLLDSEEPAAERKRQADQMVFMFMRSLQ